MGEWGWSTAANVRGGGKCRFTPLHYFLLRDIYLGAHIASDSSPTISLISLSLTNIRPLSQTSTQHGNRTAQNIGSGSSMQLCRQTKHYNFPPLLTYPPKRTKHAQKACDGFYCYRGGRGTDIDKTHLLVPDPQAEALKDHR